MSYYGPRERIFEHGPTGLTDSELLAIILMIGPKREGSTPGALHVANGLMERFSTLDGLLQAPPAQLKECFGIGVSQCAKILALRELAKRVWYLSKKCETLVDSALRAYQLFSDLAFEEQEVVAAAFLTPQLKLIQKEIIFRGAHNEVHARPREIMKTALKYNASYLVVAHNHPSQECEPSEEDMVFTTHLRWASDVVGVSLLDHLIICRAGSYFSFAEAKLLPSFVEHLSKRPSDPPPTHPHPTLESTG